MSEAHLDLGYTSPDDAIRYRRMREDARQKPLTSSQKNMRARRIEEEHARLKEHPMFEPDAETLRNMPADVKADVVAKIQRARAALDVARTGVGSTVEIEQLPEPTEPVQEELPFTQ